MKKALSLYQSTIGKKYIMAVTGFIGVAFVVGHMVGNIQAFQGPVALEHYAKLLRTSMPLLYTVRLVLLTAVVLHMIVAYQLWRISTNSRPQDYKEWEPRGSDIGSRTMRWTGPLLAAFIVYHLMHLTFGTIDPGFIPGDVYHNFVIGFQDPVASGLYIAAMIALGLHVYHGAWSMFQTMGLNNARYNQLIRGLTALVTFVVVLVNISFPIFVLTGIIHE
jgi:succinate dehydrogenase / fumarate reductase cytochrome b subunit